MAQQSKVSTVKLLHINVKKTFCFERLSDRTGFLQYYQIVDRQVKLFQHILFQVPDHEVGAEAVLQFGVPTAPLIDPHLAVLRDTSRDGIEARVEAVLAHPVNAIEAQRARQSVCFSRAVRKRSSGKGKHSLRSLNKRREGAVFTTAKNRARSTAVNGLEVMGFVQNEQIKVQRRQRTSECIGSCKVVADDLEVCARVYAMMTVQYEVCRPTRPRNGRPFRDAASPLDADCGRADYQHSLGLDFVGVGQSDRRFAQAGLVAHKHMRFPQGVFQRAPLIGPEFLARRYRKIAVAGLFPGSVQGLD